MALRFCGMACLLVGQKQCLLNKPERTAERRTVCSGTVSQCRCDAVAQSQWVATLTHAGEAPIPNPLRCRRSEIQRRVNTFRSRRFVLKIIRPSHDDHILMKRMLQPPFMSLNNVSCAWRGMLC